MIAEGLELSSTRLEWPESSLPTTWGSGFPVQTPQQWHLRRDSDLLLLLLLLLSRFSRVWLCANTDGSPSGSPVPGILQARTLEWVAISFSNARKWKVKVKSLSRTRLPATPWTAAYQAPPSMGFSRQEYWSGVPLPSPQTSWQRHNSDEAPPNPSNAGQSTSL